VQWQDDEGLDDIPASVRAAGADPLVKAGLADLFRRNCRDARGDRRPLGPHGAEALAEEALARLFDPESFRLADVGELRLHLDVASETYPGPSRIHASAWDGDAEVWRPVGELILPDAPADAGPER